MRNKLAGLLAGALSIPLCGPGWAALPDLPPAPAGQAVSELLMMDARRAIAAEHARHSLPPLDLSSGQGHGQAYPTPGAPHPAGAAKPAPLLAAIYGVGNRLHAQVIIDGQEALYASGHTRPLTANPIPWKLKRIAPPCIDLESDGGGAMRLCSARTGDQR